MYLDLGGETIVTSNELVAMIDLTIEPSEEQSGTKAEQKLKSNWMSKWNVTTIDPEDQKTLIITTNKNFISPISVMTLKRRLQNILEDRK